MRKRLRKKLAQCQCPGCKGRDGIISIFIKGGTSKQLFSWCYSCKWDISKKEVDINAKV